MIGQEEVRQIVDALEATDWMAWVRHQMSKHNALPHAEQHPPGMGELGDDELGDVQPYSQPYEDPAMGEQEREQYSQPKRSELLLNQINTPGIGDAQMQELREQYRAALADEQYEEKRAREGAAPEGETYEQKRAREARAVRDAAAGISATSLSVQPAIGHLPQELNRGSAVAGNVSPRTVTGPNSGSGMPGIPPGTAGGNLFSQSELPPGSAGGNTTRNSAASRYSRNRDSRPTREQYMRAVNKGSALKAAGQAVNFPELLAECV